MPSAFLKMKSPTGVADFVQVDPHSLDDKDVLNNSFSWVERSPTPSKKKRTTKPKTKTTTGISKQQSSDGGGTSTSTASTGIQDQIRQAQKRLAWLEDRRIKDKEDYQDQLREAKSKAREQLFGKYGPQLDQDNHSKYDSQVLETTKIINYLREDNARLRDEMKSLKKSMALLKQKNQELEAANESAKASYQELLDHVEGLQAVQEKLQTNVKVFQQATKQMKADYIKRNAYATMEAKTVARYESGLAKVLVQVQSANAPVLLAELYDMVTECGATVAQGREQSLHKAGMSMDAKQRLQTQKLLDPDLLVAEQRRKDAGGDYDSDDDDDDSSCSSKDEDESDFEQKSSASSSSDN